MAIEGRIQDVMETYPLQLTLVVDDQRTHVLLRADTVVSRGLQQVDPAQLQSGQVVQIEEQPTSGVAVVARKVNILRDALAGGTPSIPNSCGESSANDAPSDERPPPPPSACRPPP